MAVHQPVIYRFIASFVEKSSESFESIERTNFSAKLRHLLKLKFAFVIPEFVILPEKKC